MNEIIIKLLKDIPYDRLNNLIKIGMTTHEEIVNIILELNNPIFMYKYAKYINNIPRNLLEKLTEAICNTNDPSSIWAFAYYVADVDINKLAEAVCRCKNPSDIYYFALKIEESPIDKLAKAICETASPEHIYLFARNIKNAPINILTDTILKTNNPEYIRKFISILTDTDEKQKIVDYVIANKEVFLAQPEPARLYYNVAAYTSYPNKYRIEELAEILIQINDPKYLTHLASYIPKENKGLMQRLINTIYESKDEVAINDINAAINRNINNEPIEDRMENIDISLLNINEIEKDNPLLIIIFEYLISTNRFDIIEANKDKFKELLKPNQTLPKSYKKQ